MSAVIIPTLRYKDAVKAIEFLCNTFGFTKHSVFEDKDGHIGHAELCFGNSMIMLSSEKDNAFGKLVGTPKAHSGINTMSPYIILKDSEIDAHYLKTLASGAEIVYDLKVEDYGGKAYSCKDAEGYLWNFGSYNPWK